MSLRALRQLILLIPILLLTPALHADGCEGDLMAKWSRFINYLDKNGFRHNLGEVTPLDASAELRPWKYGLAIALNQPPSEIQAIFFKEHILRVNPDEESFRLILVRSVQGRLKPLLFVGYDAERGVIKYIDPIYKDRISGSSLYSSASGWRLVSHEDLLGRIKNAGLIVGAIDLKIKDFIP